MAHSRQEIEEFRQRVQTGWQVLCGTRVGTVFQRAVGDAAKAIWDIRDREIMKGVFAPLPTDWWRKVNYDPEKHPNPENWEDPPHAGE